MSVARSLAQTPEADRPREKLVSRGAAVLSDEELLAVLLGRGTQRSDVLALARQVRKVVDERGLAVSAADLTPLDGMGTAKAAAIVAALEFARRRIRPETTRIATPADALPLLRHYADRKQEHLLGITLNGANEVLHVRVVSIGLIDRTPFHPREVYADAVADRAAGLMLAHNHPAGSLEPSDADVAATKQIKAAGAILGIPLLDHVIFNRSGYYSFLEAGRL
jgi:DNA repair protein RadC